MIGNSGGPMIVAKLGSNRSYDRGRRHAPSSARARPRRAIIALDIRLAGGEAGEGDERGAM
jgi:hypothetical protein